MDTPDQAKGIAVSGNYVYVADYIAGLQIIDISNIASASIIKTVNTPGRANYVSVYNNYAFVSGSYDTDGGFVYLQIIDISNPSSASIIKTIHPPNPATSRSTIMNNYCYLADTTSGLVIIDINTISSSKIVKTIPTSDIARSVAVKDNYAYVADYEAGLQIIELWPK